MGWEALQNEINKTLGPLLTRSEYYKKGIEILRNASINYFLGKAAANALLPVSATAEQVTEFNQFKEKMRACFASKETLYAAKTGITYALTTIILESGLPLEDVECSFQLTFAQPFTPKEYAFMRQFAHVLTMYRVYVAIVERYQTLLGYSFLNSTEDFKYLAGAESLQQCLSRCEEEKTLRDILSEAKRAKKGIDRWLKPSDPSALCSQEQEFEQAFKFDNTIIMQLFEEGKIRLEKCYREFPNESYTCYIWDTDFQILLKTVAGYFFADQYDYDSGTSILSIRTSFTSALATEISDLHMKLSANQYKFRVELLCASLRLCSEIINEGKRIAALNKIESKHQAQLPSQTFFSQDYTVYHLYNDLKRQWIDNAKKQGHDEEISEDDSSELNHENNIYLFYYQLSEQWKISENQMTLSMNDEEKISTDDGPSFWSYTY